MEETRIPMYTEPLKGTRKVAGGWSRSDKTAEKGLADKHYFNTNLRRCRIAYGIKQIEMAQMVGVGDKCYQQWEYSNCRPSTFEQIAKIIEVFGMQSIAYDFMTRHLSDAEIGLNSAVSE